MTFLQFILKFNWLGETVVISLLRKLVKRKYWSFDYLKCTKIFSIQELIFRNRKILKKSKIIFNNFQKSSYNF